MRAQSDPPTHAARDGRSGDSLHCSAAADDRHQSRTPASSRYHCEVIDASSAECQATPPCRAAADSTRAPNQWWQKSFYVGPLLLDRLARATTDSCRCRVLFVVDVVSTRAHPGDYRGLHPAHPDTDGRTPVSASRLGRVSRTEGPDLCTSQWLHATGGVDQHRRSHGGRVKRVAAGW